MNHSNPPKQDTARGSDELKKKVPKDFSPLSQHPNNSLVSDYYSIIDPGGAYKQQRDIILSPQDLEEAVAAINALVERKVAEAEIAARLNEWDLISETLHSASIQAELHLSKVRNDRIEQLQRNQGRSGE